MFCGEKGNICDLQPGAESVKRCSVGGSWSRPLRLICISGGKRRLFVAVSPAKATPTKTAYRGKMLAPAPKPPTMEKPRHTRTHTDTHPPSLSPMRGTAEHKHTRTRHSSHTVGPWQAGTPISCLTLKVKITETNR